jgi:hypothetical protein
MRAPSRSRCGSLESTWNGVRNARRPQRISQAVAPIGPRHLATRRKGETRKIFAVTAGDALAPGILLCGTRIKVNCHCRRIAAQMLLRTPWPIRRKAGKIVTSDHFRERG